MTATDPRIVPCDHCGTEGRIYVLDYFYDRDGLQWGERDTGECPSCDGTGGALIETQPIDMEDLDEAPPARLGACDICNRQDVETSRAIVCGIETFHCDDCVEREP